MLGVMLLAWLVNALLLYAVSRFLNAGTMGLRIILSALLGALGVGLSLLPNVSILDTHLERGILLFVMCLTAFGISRKFLWTFALFALLHVSVGGITAQTAEPLRVVFGTAGISLACWLTREKNRLIPVELTYRQKHMKLTALYDTGNTLLDPVTGEGVLILDAPSAQKLTGLTPQQLSTPVESMEAVPGLRLIPYHTVGNSGFLLALRMADVKIGNRQESVVVAFSPENFGKDYQALTGGNV